MTTLGKKAVVYLTLAVLTVWPFVHIVLVKRLGSGPLIPLKDPMLPEALSHRNYV